MPLMLSMILNTPRVLRSDTLPANGHPPTSKGTTPRVHIGASQRIRTAIDIWRAQRTHFFSPALPSVALIARIKPHGLKTINHVIPAWISGIRADPRMGRRHPRRSRADKQKGFDICEEARKANATILCPPAGRLRHRVERRVAKGGAEASASSNYGDASTKESAGLRPPRPCGGSMEECACGPLEVGLEGQRNGEVRERLEEGHGLVGGGAAVKFTLREARDGA
ncbi:hypothetical protein K438DRAFT_2031192 [Mycena galopus ATCC 62051]|nr:hypothetical protein K438DRAFT_2031192 [Mycena galopus ATCC 62051]